MDGEKLMRMARAARERSYAPYSKFMVGAALEGKSGRVYLGCNIENAAFTPTNCAERTAVFLAVAGGEREFAAIAICGAPEDEEPSALCAPCGVCRQVLLEFCEPETFTVYMLDKGRLTSRTLAELAPLAFSPKDLQA